MTPVEAYLFLEALRWPNGPVCPHCGHPRAYYITPENGVSRRNHNGTMSVRRVWRCAQCRKQFSVLTGTLFHGSRIPANVLVSILAEGPATGSSVRKLAGRHPIDHSTAKRILQKVRSA
jgi:transposase-like protein